MGVDVTTVATSPSATQTVTVKTTEAQTSPQFEVSAEASPSHLSPACKKASPTEKIPLFLQESGSDLLNNLKSEYYVIHNPDLPKTLDVEMIHSLDHSSVVCCVRFSSDGKFLATGSNKITQVFDVETGELVAKLTDAKILNNGTDSYIRAVCFSPNGKYLATGGQDKIIRIWDLSTKTVTKYLNGHEHDIYSLDFFPNNGKLCSGSGDHTVRIWDLDSRECSLKLSIEDGATSVTVSSDGKLIAAGSIDKTVHVWDSSTGSLIQRLDSENELYSGHKDSVYSVAFTSNSSEIVSGSLDKTVKLWSLSHIDKEYGGGAEVTSKNFINCDVTYVGHKDFVLSVCSSPDSQYLLSGSKDCGVIFWEKKTGCPLLMLEGHKHSVITVSVAKKAISGAGIFATGSGDCKARVWKWTKVEL